MRESIPSIICSLRGLYRRYFLEILIDLTLDLGDAVLEDRLKDPSIIEMYHTEVPKAYRGQGIAQKLVAVSELCLSSVYGEYLSRNLLRIRPHVSSQFEIVLHTSYLKYA